MIIEVHKHFFPNNYVIKGEVLEIQPDNFYLLGVFSPVNYRGHSAQRYYDDKYINSKWKNKCFWCRFDEADFIYGKVSLSHIQKFLEAL